jgi:hypothetical protein
MIDKCVFIVSPTQMDVRWTHVTLLAEKKRKATHEELHIQSMKKHEQALFSKAWIMFFLTWLVWQRRLLHQ